MQGKFVFSQSRSTFLSWKRIRTVELRGSFRERKIERRLTRDRNRLRLRLHSLVPGRDGVVAIGHILDLVVSLGIGFGVVRSRNYQHVCGHLRMHVAEQRHDPWSIELKGSLFSRGPGSHVVAHLLVARNSWPENVVGHFIAVQKVNGGAHLDDKNVRLKQKRL